VIKASRKAIAIISMTVILIMIVPISGYAKEATYNQVVSDQTNKSSDQVKYIYLEDPVNCLNQRQLIWFGMP